MPSTRTYSLNDLCTVACDVESALGRSVDLHLGYFPTANLPHGQRADIVFHADLPTPASDCERTADGLLVDRDTVFLQADRIALRYTDRAIDVYSLRGMSPHLFVQLVGFTRGFTLVHSAAITYRGQGILLPAWGGVGKTSLVMSLMRQDDVQLLGDDLVFLCGHDGVQSYPLPFSVYHYHRHLFPELFRQRSRQRGIRGPIAVRLLHAARPFVQPLVAAFPRVEELAKRLGRGYRPVPVLEVFDRSRVAARALVRKVVCLARHTGSEFVLHSVDPESVARNLLGVVHYEYSFSPILRYLVTMGAAGQFNLADYFDRARESIVTALADASCSQLLIPENSDSSQIRDVFQSQVLDGLENDSTL